MLVGDGRYDSWDKAVLQFENRIGMESALVSLGPDLGSCSGVDELDDDPQFRTGLAEAAFHHIACPEFLANRADVGGLVGVLESRAAGDERR